ncbi:MAG: hypothetical protein VKP57_11385 [Candidatus Sericytochromatia bacterium]|nr:hypothetical protein [Candidatus Sericytochromatia bacterium]
MSRRPAWLDADPGHPVVIGHRGMGRTPGHGENQIEAFEAAWNKGLAVVECDVRRMADGSSFMTRRWKGPMASPAT